MAYDAAAKKGSAFLLQKGATTIGGFRTRSLAFNSEIVDVTSADDTNRFRQLLAAAGIKTLAISGSGIIKDTAAQQALATDINAQTVDTYTITVPGIGTFAGPFQLNKLDFAGTYNGEATFDIGLESGGDITITLEG